MDLLRCTNYCTTKTRLNRRSMLGALATSDQLWRWGAYNAACRTTSLFAQGSHKTTDNKGACLKKKMLAKWPSVPRNLARDTFLKCYTVYILTFWNFISLIQKMPTSLHPLKIPFPCLTKNLSSRHRLAPLSSTWSWLPKATMQVDVHDHLTWL